MEQLIEHIQRFNRKERFILVGQALGNPSFVLGREFKTKLADCLQRAIPDDAYCAMDYHLDWLFAALTWTYQGARLGSAIPRNLNDVHPETTELTDLKVAGNQSDIDMLVVWVDERRRGQVVLLEAKGYTPWDPKQMRYKSARLAQSSAQTGAASLTLMRTWFCTGPPPGPTKAALRPTSGRSGRGSKKLMIHPSSTSSLWRSPSTTRLLLSESALLLRACRSHQRRAPTGG